MDKNYIIRISKLELELIKKLVEFKNVEISNRLNLFWREIDNINGGVHAFYIKLKNDTYEYADGIIPIFQNIYFNIDDVVLMTIIKLTMRKCWKIFLYKIL